MLWPGILQSNTEVSFADRAFADFFREANCIGFSFASNHLAKLQLYVPVADKTGHILGLTLWVLGRL